LSGLTGNPSNLEMTYSVCILASEPGGTLHVGVTNNLIRRVYVHRAGPGRRLYQAIPHQNAAIFRADETIAAALQREKNIKHWSREWTIDLIVAGNPGWRDLYEEIVR
jgi:putative endonuclease